MRSSFIYYGLLLLAAGSEGKPLPQDVDPNAGIQLIANGSTVPTGTGTGQGSPVGGGQGSCPGFRNVVFNGNASNMAGWPEATWNSLASHGVSDWVGFTMQTPDRTTPGLTAGQIPLVMTGDNLPEAMQLLSTNPPPYLGLYNEPDFSFQGQTKVTDAATAARELKDIIMLNQRTTKYLSPALAFPNSDWLGTFSDTLDAIGCTGCFANNISIISMHVYSPDPEYIMGQIQQLHAKWNKPIWVTELGPATQGCTLTVDEEATWMKSLLPRIQALGYVEKIFWNCGEFGMGLDGTPNGPCNPSLTYDNGSPTPLLTAFGELCGGLGSGAAVQTS